MPTYDPKKVRPKKDFISVKCDPRKTVLDSGIILPEIEVGAEKVMERAGTVIRLGAGDKVMHSGLKEGDRIVFRGFLKHANPIETDDGQEYFLMSVDDVMAVADGDFEVGAFSGSAAVPERR